MERGVEPVTILFLFMEAAMAEWLRRLTRNQMGSSRVGSNPTRSVDLICRPLLEIVISKMRR